MFLFYIVGSVALTLVVPVWAVTTVSPTANPGGSPNFTNLPFSMNFAEGQSVNTFIYQMAASTPDGATGIVFAIHSTHPDDASSSVQITSDGRLTSAAILDADVGTPVTYVIEVSVCDTFTASQCNYDNLTLTVTEGNDPPVFTPAQVALTLAESTAVGTVLPTSWSIADEDGAFTFSYSIDPATVAPSYFSVHSSSGAITLTSSLDYENTTEFPDHAVVIVLKAADPGGLQGSVNITITITDVNDCAPTFPSTPCTGNVVENAAVGTSVLSLTASDCDVTASYANFSFYVTAPADDIFSIRDEGNGSAALVTSAGVDRESVGNLQGVVGVGVEARDAGGLTSARLCLVTVADENEFAPELAQSGYEYYVRYDAAVGTSVDRLVATDADSTGRPFEYSAYGLPGGLFLGVYDGQVMITGALEKNVRYSFTVNASDRGQPPRSSNTVEVVVHTFDPVPALTDWAIDTGGAYFGREEEQALVANIRASCAPCSPGISGVFQSTVNSNHWVARVYITTDNTNSTEPARMWSKEEILARYTTGDGRTPTPATVQLGPNSYPVVTVQDTYTVNWWLETPEGIATTCVLTLLGAALLGAATALISYKYWWKHRPENRQYLDFN